MSLIVYNSTDLKEILSKYNRVVHVGIYPKMTDHLHDGHVECINVAKTLGDIVYVSFYNVERVSCHLFGGTESENPNKFDEQYCVSWCKENNVDVVYIPTNEDADAFCSNFDKEQKLNEIKDICITEGYNIDKLEENYLYLFILMEKVRYELDLWPKHIQVSTWHDGYIRFIQSHFAPKYCGYNVHLIDPVIDPATGLPYSTNLMLVDDQVKSKLNLIKQEAEKQKDLANSQDEIKQNIYSKIDKHIELLSDDIQIYSGGFIGNNTLVTTYLTLTGESLFNSMGVANRVVINNLYKGVQKSGFRNQ
jgi:hypothetical protein